MPGGVDATVMLNVRRMSCSLGISFLLAGARLAAQSPDSAEAAPSPQHAPEVKRYLDWLHDPSHRLYACRATTRDEFLRWREPARNMLRKLLRLDDMGERLAAHQPTVTLGQTEDLGGYTRTRGRIRTEPEMWVPFWMLRPAGRGPFPVGIFLHGHSRDVGMDETVGIAASEERRKHIQEAELDVGLRAVRRGFIALVPAVRGFKPVEVADLIGMYNNKPCRTHSTHCLMGGRTAFGERIWDIQRLIDYAQTIPGADSRKLLVMGHSGGGGLAAFAAAVEPRIAVTVSSGWYNTLVADNGRLNHCECNTVPGILQFGEVWDVAGLIAPRPFLVVSGTRDLARRAYAPEVVRAVGELRRIYLAAGAPANFDQAVGEGGHKYFNVLQWPFVMEHLQD